MSGANLTKHGVSEPLMRIAVLEKRKGEKTLEESKKKEEEEEVESSVLGITVSIFRRIPIRLLTTNNSV